MSAAEMLAAFERWWAMEGRYLYPSAWTGPTITERAFQVGLKAGFIAALAEYVGVRQAQA